MVCYIQRKPFPSKRNNTQLIIYLPSTWIKTNGIYSNSNNTCTVSTVKTKKNIDEIKKIIPYKLNYTKKVLKNITIKYNFVKPVKGELSTEYGYHKDNSKEVHVYIFQEPGDDDYYYIIYKKIIGTNDPDCDEFINNIEQRIIIDY